MSLLILPVIIVAAQEAIRAVPKHLSQKHLMEWVLQNGKQLESCFTCCYSRILTGTILAFSRAIGETAPLS